MACTLINMCAQNLCKQTNLVQLCRKCGYHVFFGTQCIKMPVKKLTMNFICCCRFIYCEKCFTEVQEDDIELNDDPMQPAM